MTHCCDPGHGDLQARQASFRQIRQNASSQTPRAPISGGLCAKSLRSFVRLDTKLWRSHHPGDANTRRVAGSEPGSNGYGTVIVDSSSTRTESCVAIRPDPRAQMPIDAPKAAGHNGCQQVIRPSRVMGAGLKILGRIPAHSDTRLSQRLQFSSPTPSTTASPVPAAARASHFPHRLAADLQPRGTSQLAQSLDPGRPASRSRP
jgi:hypothetical protein